MSTSTHDKFLTDIERFLRKHDMRPTTLGLSAINDAKLVSNLRLGKDVTTRTMDRVRAFMSSYTGNSEKKIEPARMAG